MLLLFLLLELDLELDLEEELFLLFLLLGEGIEEWLGDLMEVLLLWIFLFLGKLLLEILLLGEEVEVGGLVLVDFLMDFLGRGCF